MYYNGEGSSVLKFRISRFSRKRFSSTFFFQRHCTFTIIIIRFYSYENVTSDLSNFGGHRARLTARNYSRRSRLVLEVSRARCRTRGIGEGRGPGRQAVVRRKYASRIRVDSNFVGRRRHHAVHESISCQPRRARLLGCTTRDFLARNGTSGSVGAKGEADAERNATDVTG